MSDLIPVREDEQVDVGRLTGWLGSQDGMPAGQPDVRQFGGGKANLTYLLTFPDGTELVLRRPPLGPVAPGSHDMSREFRVLNSLWRAFPLAAKALAICRDESVIGNEFFIMERLGGVVVRDEIPEIFGSGDDVNANRKLSEVVIRTLGEFHAVDPDACGLGDLGHPEGFLSRQVSGWASRWQGAKHQENPTAEMLSNWLRDHLPPEPTPTLLHNDWRLDNMAVSPDDPGVCTAVYDWDMATRGDPLADLGTLMGSWFDPGEAPGDLGMMPTTATGWMDRNTAIDLYGSVSGNDLAHIDWYLVFGSWKLAIVLQQIYIRWLRGQTKDERFAKLDDGARLLFDLAAVRMP